MSTLYAIYDLRVSPPSFDFAIFLQCAELHRQRYKLTNIQVLVIKEQRLHKTPLSQEEGNMMLNNIVLPMCELLPTVSSVQLLPEGAIIPDVQPEHIYPLDYTKDYPTPGFLLGNLLSCIVRGETPVQWTPPASALKLVDSFLQRHSNRKLLTLNLRENPDIPTRNSSIPEWRKFWRSIDKSKYIPVVIRETCRIYEPLGWPGVIELPEASINLGLRAAFYNRAFMNLFVANGPMLLSQFSPAKTLMIKMQDENNKSTSKNWFEHIQGFSVGGQLACVSQQHKYYWLDDTVDNIKKAFIDLHGERGQQLWPIDIPNMLKTLTVYLNHRFHHMVADEDVKLLSLLPFERKHLEYIFHNNEQAFKLLSDTKGKHA